MRGSWPSAIPPAGWCRPPDSPARVVQLQNEFGAVTGERWEYDIDGKTVGFTIRNGKVERIDESR